MQLKKPVVFLDIEATGLNLTRDRIIEISLIKVNPDGREEIKTWQIDPQQPLTPEMSAFLKVTDADLAGKPPFREVAHDINKFLEGCDLGGFNLFKLDLPILMEEFLKAGIDFDIGKRKLVDVQKIFHIMEKRNLAAAYSFYCGKELVDNHSAEADAIATKEVFKAQLGKYPQLGSSMDEICAYTADSSPQLVDLVGRIVMNEEGKEVFNFGKYRMQTVTDVLRRDPAYYGWMMKGDFTSYTKKKLTEIRLRMKQSGSGN